MFWALFGLGHQEDPELEGFGNGLTVTFGTILYGLYHITIQVNFFE